MTKNKAMIEAQAIQEAVMSDKAGIEGRRNPLLEAAVRLYMEEAELVAVPRKKLDRLKAQMEFEDLMDPETIDGFDAALKRIGLFIDALKED